MSVFLRKEQAGGVGDYLWPHDGAVLEVDDITAVTLLRIGHAGFSVATPIEDPIVAQEAEAATEEQPETPSTPLEWDPESDGQNRLSEALTVASPTSKRRSPKA